MQECWTPGDDREHTLWRYTDQIYKIIQWYRPRMPVVRGPSTEFKHYESKLDAAISRARRVVLEKALCNSWDWFCTFTIAADKADRDDLPGWWRKFAQWLRDQRKKGYEIKYLLVPEKHIDGSWHAHGFLAGLPADQLVSFKQMDASGYRSSAGRRLPKRLIKSEYMNWPAYQEKFGFCSLGVIRDPVAAAFYIVKYITKDQARMVTDVGQHLYYCSRPLNVAVKDMDFYGRDPFIDTLLVNKYDFCATGMTQVRHDLDWTFPLLLENGPFVRNLVPLDFTESVVQHPADVEAQAYYDFEQLAIDWAQKNSRYQSTD